jgi:hypothetical protein
MTADLLCVTQRAGTVLVEIGPKPSRWRSCLRTLSVRVTLGCWVAAVVT